MNNKLVNYNTPGCPGTEFATNTIKGHKRTKRESIAEVNRGEWNGCPFICIKFE